MRLLRQIRADKKNCHSILDIQLLKSLHDEFEINENIMGNQPKKRSKNRRNSEVSN